MEKKTAQYMYKTMYKIRIFEEKVEELFAAGELPGFVHLYIGQEACATGVCANLTEEDYITSTHRGHGHCIAKGGEMSRMMAELFGKKTGYNGGKGGSMHIAYPGIGILGANGINAAGMPLAAGAALSSKMRGKTSVAVAFFGDGASNQGTFHEAINFAAALKLPVLFVCENNQFGVGTRITESTAIQDIAKRADGYGIPGVIADGMDVFSVYEAAKPLIGNARKGGGPALLELKTWRYRAHFQGEPASYRTKEEEDQWLDKDPIRIAGQKFSNNGLLSAEDIRQLEKDADRELAEAVSFARNSAFPDPSEALENVFAD